MSDVDIVIDIVELVFDLIFSSSSSRSRRRKKRRSIFDDLGSSTMDLFGGNKSMSYGKNQGYDYVDDSMAGPYNASAYKKTVPSDDDYKMKPEKFDRNIYKTTRPISTSKSTAAIAATAYAKSISEQPEQNVVSKPKDNPITEVPKVQPEPAPIQTETVTPNTTFNPFDVDYGDDYMPTTGDSIILQVLMLRYILKQDDGVVDKKEEKAIKNHISSVKHLLGEQEVKEIMYYHDKDTNIYQIQEYIDNKNISTAIVAASISTMRRIDRDFNKFRSIIDNMQTLLLDF